MGKFQIDFEAAKVYREQFESARRARYIPPSTPICPPETHDDDSLHYVGGLLDAEGSFYFSRDRPAISAYNNNRQLLEKIESVIGGKIYENHRGEFHLRVGLLEGVRAACHKISQFLILKREQALVLAEACDTYTEERERLVARVVEMNAKDKNGVRPEVDEELLATDLQKCSAGEWAYFAGYIDGDAALTMQRQVCSKREYFYPQIHIYSTNPKPLVWMRDRFGGKLEARKRGEKTAWMSCLSFEDQAYVASVLGVLKHHVIEKRDAAELLLESTKLPANERMDFFVKIKEVNARFRGRHKFVKNADGTYSDHKRSLRKHGGRGEMKSE